MATARYDVSAAVALGAAAYEQQLKGRYARCAELWGRAAEAARALGAPDCLVLANAQLCQAEALHALIRQSSDGADVADDARFKLVMDLVPAVAEVLERRRIAGTLLYGKCAPHEVEWQRQWLEAGGCDAAALIAPFVGYEAYVTAARLMLRGFTDLYENWTPKAPLPTEIATPPRMRFVASAVDLVCDQRPHEHMELFEEAMLVQHVRHWCLNFNWPNRSDRGGLLAAWSRLENSGIVARRHLERMYLDNANVNKEADANAKADADALGLRSCAHCGAKEVHVVQFKCCAACKDKGALYCSKECHRAAWPAHKAACKAACKAAKGAA